MSGVVGCGLEGCACAEQGDPPLEPGRCVVCGEPGIHIRSVESGAARGHGLDWWYCCAHWKEANGSCWGHGNDARPPAPAPPDSYMIAVCGRCRAAVGIREQCHRCGSTERKMISVEPMGMRLR